MKILIRADAAAHIGTGHVMRCLALAQTLHDSSGSAVFAMVNPPSTIEARLQSEGIEVVRLRTNAEGSADDATQTTALAKSIGAAWVVVDGYHFSAQYQKIIKDAGLHLLFIDDYGHCEHYYADIVLNQNIDAREALIVSRDPYTQLLLGTSFALLRREIQASRDWQRQIPETGRNLLVTLGGGDNGEAILKVIQALEQVNLEGLEAVVLTGMRSPIYEDIEFAVRHSHLKIYLQASVTNMPELMSWADFAVSAGGSTCWELAFMCLPNAIMILADNQRGIAEGLDAAGASVNMGWHTDLTPSQIAEHLQGLLISPERRAAMSTQGRELVDGDGARRVLEAMRRDTFTLRRATADDCRMVWEWANDPVVRASAFSSNPIPWEAHVDWFQRKLNDPTCLILIALDADSQPIGQMRFDLFNDHEAEIDVSIDQGKRGLGHGSHLIRLGTEFVFDTTKINAVHAYVKPENRSSVSAFEKAHFVSVGTKVVKDTLAVHYAHVKGEDNKATVP